MPSGARKRKANKKKKATKNPTSTSTSRAGDGKQSQYESDAREASDFLVTERGLKQDDKYDKKKRGSSKSSTSSTSSDDEKDISVKENAPVVDSFSEEPSQVTHTTAVSKSEQVSLDDEVVEGSSASSVNSTSSNVEGKSENGEVVMDLAPEMKKDEATKAATTSDAKKSAGHESEEKPMLSYNAPREDAVKDAERVKDSEFTGYSDRQPLIASPAQPVKTTSWKSCCGLFEAFTGSSA